NAIRRSARRSSVLHPETPLLLRASLSCERGARLVCGFNPRLNVSFRMRGADNPMQAIRWSHVNTAFEQQVYEAGITGGINIGTVIAVVVNRVAISEVDLEHRPKALNDCVHLSPAEHFAQTRNRGIPQRMQPAIRIVH